MTRIGSVPIRFTGWVVLGVSVATLLPSAAQAACMGDWDLSGELQYLQGDSYGWFTLEQRGSELTGLATYAGGGGLTGKIEGTIHGNAVSMTVYWDSGPVGVYAGTVSPQGWIVGETHDLMHPGTNAQWRSEGQVGCQVVETTTPPSSASSGAVPKPNRVLGKKKKAQTSGSTVLQGADSSAVIVQPAQSATSMSSAADALAAVVNQPATCKSGYVWREARPEDLVCVTPEARARTAEENQRAVERRDPAGAYGPNTCISGFVWREAFAGDVVCVTPEVRALVREENRLGASRRVGG